MNPYCNITNNKENPKLKYKKLLKSPLWFSFRDSILDRDNRQCLVCKEKNDLEVHHMFYFKKFTAPYEYPHQSLITLCSDCHNHFHKNRNVNREVRSFSIVTDERLIELQKLKEEHIFCNKEIKES